MKIVYTEKSRQELEQLPEKARKLMKKSLKELSEKKLNYEKVGLVKTPERDYFKLKIRDAGANPEINHRAIFDIVEGKKTYIRVEKIGHRDQIEYD